MSDNYTNPNATIYIVSGAAGNIEGLLWGWTVPTPEFNAFGENDYFGYGILQSFNNTHLRWNFYESYDDVVRDSIWIIKERWLNIGL